MLRRCWSFLLILLASSLVMTAAVHARETPGPVTIECSGSVHSDGNADQTPADADQGMPHHHGTCHGQSASLPTADETSSMPRHAASRLFPAAQHATASHSVDPALRPPTA